jgi:hypothetical protein
MEKLEGSYCPLCGEIGLQTKKVGSALYAYCPNGASGPKDAHTSYVIDGGSKPAPKPTPEQGSENPKEDSTEEEVDK